MSNLYLQHHGIKGQKWGKRNGPPYPLDYEDHSAAEKRKNSKEDIDRKPSDKDGVSRTNRGASRDLSQKAVNQRALKVAAACAAGALGVSAAYCLIRSHNMNSDTVLKAGAEVYRVASSDSTELRDFFYAATNKNDNAKYKGLYSVQKRMQAKLGMIDSDRVFNKTITANKDIKVCGARNAKRIFEQLKNSDPEFARAYQFRDYDSFNRSGLMMSKNSGVNKRFFDALAKEGYGGLIDINDSKYSGYEAKKPVIFFDQQQNMSVDSVREIERGEIGRNYAAAYGQILVENILKSPALATTGAALVGMNISTKRDERQRIRNKKAEKGKSKS